MESVAGRRRLGRLAALVLCAAAGPAAAGWLAEVEIRAEPVRDDGQQDYTVRLLPATNHTCGEVVFDCVYRQEFAWENAWGRKYTKVHEPVTFTYRRPNVRLVRDLDAYVSFRAPVSRARLEQIYGKGVFNKDAPITIDRLRIAAYGPAGPLWSYELKAGAKHDVSRPLAEPPPAAPGVEAKDR